MTLALAPLCRHSSHVGMQWNNQLCNIHLDTTIKKNRLLLLLLLLSYQMAGSGLEEHQNTLEDVMIKYFLQKKLEIS